MLLIGCVHYPPAILSETDRSVSYCWDGSGADHPDQLAETHCQRRGLHAKEVVNESQCFVGHIPTRALGNQYSYECVK